ncbi:MAG: ATP-binding cassette domain-containing protein [Myxococcota bacterium]
MTLTLHQLVLRLPNGTVGPLDARWGPGVVLLRGPNGCGKTTLLRVACGERAPDGGTVYIDGRDPARDAEVRAHVSFLPAVPELSGFLQVDEAWRMMAALRGRPGWDGAPARDALGLPGGRRLDALSVGQRRKAELLAAMAGDPAVLLLDEVFAPLDPDATAVVAAWIAAWRVTRLVVVTGHGAVPVEPDVVVTLGVSR